MKEEKCLPNSFFEEKTLKVARELVGKYLIRQINGRIIREKITEVEAYIGPHDLACHSSNASSQRGRAMQGEAGTIFVYLTYGMHWMLNILTEKKGFGSAILVRGTENFPKPAILTKALVITNKLNGKKLGKKSGLWIEESFQDLKPKANKIIREPRIGVASAGKIWANKPYRFILK
jgi:DNA-3-methyladenine glycosylase